MKALNSILIISIIAIVIASCNSNLNNANKQIIGVKAYEVPTDINATLNEWKELNFNTVFISKEIALNTEFVTKAKQNNIKLFLIAPIFYNPDALQKHPEWYAIKSNGKKAQADWVEFVCPSQTEYIHQLTDSLKNLVKNTKVDGISLDFIRHFLYWEMVTPQTNPDSIPNTCFCEKCVNEFEKKYGLTIPKNNTIEVSNFIISNYNNEWTEFKQWQIESTVAYLVNEIKKTNPDIKINLHAVPWLVSNYNGSIYSKAGQNIKNLSKYVDYISPMLYHHMTHNSTMWIKQTIDSMNRYAPDKIIPSIQVLKEYRTAGISDKEFEESLNNSLAKPSLGVILWSWDQLKTSKSKKQIIKKQIK